MRLTNWLEEHALPLWWEKGADRKIGGYFEALDMSRQPAGSGRRARVICRQVYVYCAAARRSGGGAYLEAAQHGLSFLNSHFIRDDGLIRARLDSGGGDVGEEPTLYDQAFCLFALAHAAAAGLSPLDCRDRARRLMAKLEAEWRNPAGGFIERDPLAHQSNPHMHLLEATLSWETLDREGPWGAVADEIAELALGRFIDKETGALREFFDAQWSPAPGDAGRIVEPGHQFEWSWLLSRFAQLRGRAEVAAKALRLYRIGREYGVDPERGVAFDQMFEDFSPKLTRARLWPQTEWIKACAILSAGATDDTERQSYQADLALASRALQKYFTTSISGLWWDKMEPDGSFIDEPSPASSFYHIACAIWEAQDQGVRI